MLDSMRALSKSIVSKILMGLLVLSFGVWGVGDALNAGGASYAAKIGSEIVSVGEFQRSASLLKSQLEEAGMKGLSSEQIQASALRQIVQQRLGLAAMKDLGLFANDTLVATQIAAMPQFHDKKTGKFSSEVYHTTLKNNRLSEHQLIANLKSDTNASFLAASLNMQDSGAPESVRKLESTISRETRDAVIFVIPATDAMDEKNTAAMQKFYDENKESLYMLPESRTLAYVVLTKAELDALVDRAITDAMVDETIQAKPELNKQLARMKLRDEQRDSIIRETTNTIEDELAAGKPLAEALAKAGITSAIRSLEKATAFAAQTSSDPILKTVVEQGFSLGAGEVSGLIRAKSGDSLIVSVKSITPATPKPFEDVRADVKDRLGKSLARQAAQAKAISVKEALSGAPNWQSVASDKKLATRILSKLARPAEGKPATTDIPAPLQQAIFEREVGQIAGPMARENGDQLLALVTASYLPPLADSNKTIAPQQQQAITDRLARDIENRAYLSFSKAHKVTINPAVIQQSQPTNGTEE